MIWTLKRINEVWVFCHIEPVHFEKSSCARHEFIRWREITVKSNDVNMQQRRYHSFRIRRAAHHQVDRFFTVAFSDKNAQITDTWFDKLSFKLEDAKTFAASNVIKLWPFSEIVTLMGEYQIVRCKISCDMKDANANNRTKGVVQEYICIHDAYL